MAYVGLAYIVMAQLESFSNGKPMYKNGFVAGEAISADITPNYNEGSLYGNNRQVEYAKEFKQADIKLGLTRLPVIASEVLYGHTLSDDKKEVIYKTDDNSSYVGTGLYVDEIIDGKRQYVASWIYKVKYNETSEAYATKGDSIEFKTPSLEGKALGIENKQWRTTKVFENEDDAIAWLKELAHIAEETPDQEVTPTIYTEETLNALTIDQIKNIAAERGYTITQTVKAEIITEFLTQQNA